MLYSVLYEDDNYFIVNKKSGVLCHGNKYEKDSLIKDINKNGRNYYLAHRIDRNTSGALILTKNKRALNQIQSLFLQNKIEKLYLSIVSKELPAKKIRISLSLGRSRNNKLMFSNKNARNYKSAETEIQVLSGRLILVSLKTGRTHQIRAHLSSIGCSILNDPVYSKECFDSDFGQYLHSYKLSFICPISEKPIKVCASIPKEFLDKLKELGIEEWTEM